jgi:hypothetical protein
VIFDLLNLTYLTQHDLQFHPFSHKWHFIFSWLSNTLCVCVCIHTYIHTIFSLSTHLLLSTSVVSTVWLLWREPQ